MNDSIQPAISARRILNGEPVTYDELIAVARWALELEDAVADATAAQKLLEAVNEMRATYLRIAADQGWLPPPTVPDESENP